MSLPKPQTSPGPAAMAVLRETLSKYRTVDQDVPVHSTASTCVIGSSSFSVIVKTQARAPAVAATAAPIRGPTPHRRFGLATGCHFLPFQWLVNRPRSLVWPTAQAFVALEADTERSCCTCGKTATNRHPGVPAACAPGTARTTAAQTATPVTANVRSERFLRLTPR